MKKKIRVVVGMSGGVDSSVTAALLQEQGFDVVGIFMKNWDDEVVRTPVIDGCSSAEDQEDARKVAETLGIPFHIMHFEREYWDHVFQDFINGYKEGRTPNPDVLCNKFIKFGYFLEKAKKEFQADFIATGHYVRLQEKNGTFELLQAVDKNKDQSYFLWTLTQKQLRHSMFPLGDLTKPEVRELAKKFGLTTALKKDSQGICFVGEVELREFLEQWIKPHKGDILTIDSKKIGEHDGAEYFTMGQRHGLNVGGGIPYYVVKKDIQKNIVYVVAGSSHSSLFSNEVIIENSHWINKAPKEGDSVLARIRYRQPLQKARLKRIKNQELGIKALKLIFEDPQRAVTPGQSAVIYDGETMLGGGIIKG